MYQPRVSIITVTYQAQRVLPYTLASVAVQTYPHIEYIVVDGGSTDGTVALIEQAAAGGLVHRWVSERDSGLYDAMNKGMRMATGDYVWFMNAGDEIYAPDTTEQALAAAPDADVYYGQAMLLDEQRQPAGLRRHKRLPDHLTWQDMKYGMVVCHQSLIVKKAIAPDYNLAHPLSGDIDWTIRVLRQAKKVQHTGLILSKFLLGGMSAKRRRRSWEDRWQVLRQHFGLGTALAVHAGFALGAVWDRLTGNKKPA